MPIQSDSLNKSLYGLLKARGYEPVAKDSTGKTMHVILKQAKPYDFERAEGLVVTGQVKNGIFVATEVLLKCPSKYNQQKKIV